jgi:Kelch motif/Galactose oxidase, central domain
MMGSTVTAFAVNSTNGANGTLLGTTTTGTGGAFTLKIAAQAGPVRITASGGSYTSEMNGASIGAPGAVSILLASANADTSGILLNPVATFVDTRTVGILAQGGTTFSAALSAATTRIEQIYGLTSDPGSLNPNYDTTGNDQANLGLILGAIINEDQYLCPGSPGALVTALAADISDGVFDGMAAGAPVPYCGSNLPAIAGTTDFQDALSGLAQLQQVTQAFIFGGTGNILTTNGLANLALDGTTAYPIAPLATINQAIANAAPVAVNSFAPVSQTAKMNAARYDAASALLSNGKFLIAGGGGSSGAFLATIEVYDPASNTFSAATPAMSSARANETATLLPNGLALIAGGAVDNSTWTASTDLYDPMTNTITAGPSMSIAREGATAILLPNGLVLIAGGRDSTGTLNSTDLYDPVKNVITPGPPLIVARYDCAAALLPNGKVLIAGGFAGVVQSNPLNSTEIYDPALKQFTAGPLMSDARGAARATLLPDGLVLIAGGTDAVGVVNTTELYDSGTNAFSAGPAMTAQRKFQAQVLLPNGKVLVAGGYANNAGDSILSSTEVYDPANKSFTAGPSMNDQRGLASAALLQNGEVIIAGGASVRAGIQSTTDLYTP